jgi:MraZ protein
MFLGEFRHSVDEKGRLTVPARYRQLLANGGYVTHGLDQNAMVWQKESFEAVARKLSQQSFTDPLVREFSRIFLASAQSVEPDASGRIMVPGFLREKHGFEGETVVVGMGDYFEIWTPAGWETQASALDKSRDTADYYAKLNLFAAQP